MTWMHIPEHKRIDPIGCCVWEILKQARPTDANRNQNRDDLSGWRGARHPSRVVGIFYVSIWAVDDTGRDMCKK